MEKDVCTVLLVVLPVPKWKRSMPCISNTIVILFATLALLLMLSTLCHTTFAPLYLNCIAPFSYPPFPTVHLAISSSYPSSEAAQLSHTLAKISHFFNGCYLPSSSHILLLLLHPLWDNQLFRSVTLFLSESFFYYKAFICPRLMQLLISIMLFHWCNWYTLDEILPSLKQILSFSPFRSICGIIVWFNKGQDTVQLGDHWVQSRGHWEAARLPLLEAVWVQSEAMQARASCRLIC